MTLSEKCLAAFSEAKNEHGGDTEVLHGIYDAILCELLTELGYADVVAEFEKLEKWCA